MVKNVVELPPNSTGRDRNSLSTVNKRLPMVVPEFKSHAELTEEIAETRPKYAPMLAHREMAAQVLATGGSYRLAANHAGISVRQVKKYLTSPDFRARVEELRTLMMSKVRGRLMKEMVRRTTPSMLKQTELMDFLRIFDRVYGNASKNGGINIAGDINVNNYDTFLQALLAPDGSAQGEDFQSFTIDGTAVSVEDSPF